MPFRQRLRSTFLRLPCSYGGPRFTSRREESEPVPPARVCLPQAGSSDIESAPPPPAISRIRGIPGVHEDTLNFIGAGGRYPERTADGEGHRVGRNVVDDRSDDYGDDGGEERCNGRATGETKRMFAMGPDDPPSSLREPGHYDNIGNPILDPDSSQRSQLEDSYRLPSFENSISDYSSHSITHSIDIIPPPSYPERINAKHPNHADTYPECFSQGASVTDMEGDANDLNLGERPAGNSSVTSGGGPAVCGGDIVVGSEGYPGIIDDRKLPKQAQEKRELMFKRLDRGSDKEDGQHKYAGLCADEIAQGITLKQNQETPVVTTVETNLLEPIVHTRVQPREREEVTNVITRETHTTHIHPTIQPIVNPIYLPQKYYLERVPGSGQLVEITPEQAARSGWDEVWRGSWAVGRGGDVRCGGGAEETRSVKGTKAGCRTEVE